MTIKLDKLREEDVEYLATYTLEYVIENQIPIYSFRKCICCKRAYPVELMVGFTCFYCEYRKHVSPSKIIQIKVGDYA